MCHESLSTCTLLDICSHTSHTSAHARSFFTVVYTRLLSLSLSLCPPFPSWLVLPTLHIVPYNYSILPGQYLGSRLLQQWSHSPPFIPKYLIDSVGILASISFDLHVAELSCDCAKEKSAIGTRIGWEWKNRKVCGVEGEHVEERVASSEAVWHLFDHHLQYLPWPLLPPHPPPPSRRASPTI